MTDPFAQYGQQPQQFGQQPPAPAQFTQAAAQSAPMQTTEQQFAAQQTPAPASDDSSSLFGGGNAYMSFADQRWFGVPRGGQIIAKRMSNQTDTNGKVKTWDDNSPRKQVIVTLQTNERVSAEDTGKRDLYVKGYMVSAVREALQNHGKNDLEIGAWLFVAWVDGKDVGQPSKAKLYSAQYTPLGMQPPALASQQPAPGQHQGMQPIQPGSAPQVAVANPAPVQQPPAPAGPAPVGYDPFNQQAAAQPAPVVNPFG